MNEYPKLKKGTLVWHGAWPAIVMQSSRRKHKTALEPIMCEVWGFAHECGSCYRQDLHPAHDRREWEDAVRFHGGDPEDRYFKGELILFREVRE